MAEVQQGDILLATSGDYRNYAPGEMAVVLAPFDVEQAYQDYHAVDHGSMGYFEWLSQRGRVKRVPYQELWFNDVSGTPKVWVEGHAIPSSEDPA